MYASSVVSRKQCLCMLKVPISVFHLCNLFMYVMLLFYQLI